MNSIALFYHYHHNIILYIFNALNQYFYQLVKYSFNKQIPILSKCFGAIINESTVTCVVTFY